MEETTMKELGESLEKSYELMGDGVHNTDELLAWKKAEEYYEEQKNITVSINGVVKGGLTADFEGIRAFIPVSKISLSRIDDLNPYLETEMTVRVFEVNMDEDKLVLSAKEILMEQREQTKQKKMSEISVGDVFHGTVDTIKNYGAFINLGDGLSGLVHISQISYTRIKHPGVVLKEGQEVDVKVIEIKDGKLSLSIKALLENPEDANIPAEDEFEIPESENIGTSMGDLLKNIKLS